MKKFYHLNQSIRAKKVRLVGPGVSEELELDEALKRAQAEGKDLVEVSENVDPPVVKIIDFKKFLFEEKKKLKKVDKSKAVLKELRLSPVIAENDLNIRVERAKEFLKSGNPVKMSVFFRGREITHPDLGKVKLNQVIELLAPFGKPSGEPKWAGPTLSVTFTQVK